MHVSFTGMVTNLSVADDGMSTKATFDENYLGADRTKSSEVSIKFLGGAVGLSKYLPYRVEAEVLSFVGHEQTKDGRNVPVTYLRSLPGQYSISPAAVAVNVPLPVVDDLPKKK